MTPSTDIKSGRPDGKEHDVVINGCTIVKYVYSIMFLLFSIGVIMALIFNEKTTLSQDVDSIFGFVVIWVGILWLSMVEGSQAALVGLPPVDKDLYKDTHPITHKITSLAHKGDNLDRYLIGRQFMVLLIVFVINLAGAPLEEANVFGWPKVVQDIVVVSGVAMILMTAMIGQLTSQVNASHCMLDYINSYFAQFTVYVAMAIEFSGVMHASYLVQMLSTRLANKRIVSKEPPLTFFHSVFFWCRCVLSLVILTFSFVVTIAAIFEGKTTMWDGVPQSVSLILFFVLMSVVGMLEGMQIAFFAVSKLPAAERGDSTFAKRTCELLFSGNGQNLPGFMVGRQLCVVSCFFIIARVTTLNVDVGNGENVLGVSDGVQEFLNTGLHAAVITTIVASISWQLVASAFPISFISNPLTYVLLRVCLLLEATGICAGVWVLARIQKKISGFQYDEVYIGTPETRAAKQHADLELNITKEIGTLSGSAFPAGAAPVGTIHVEDPTVMGKTLSGNKDAVTRSLSDHVDEGRCTA